MCMMSVVSGHYQGVWPKQEWPAVTLPEYTNYQQLVEKARKYDELMKQPDCPDPAKEAWMKQLDVYMKDRFGLEPASGR